MQFLDQKKSVLAFIAFFACFAVGIITIFKGTGDTGDSIGHFIIAQKAWQQPILYFDNWGKPLFTLLASPFAQFGFDGIKVFNVLVSLGAIWFACDVAHLLGVKNRVVVGLVMVTCNFYFLMMFSGLTEHLYSLALIASIWLMLKEKWAVAVILLSFLPFIRSEAAITLPPIIVYLCLKKQWKYLPLLTFGTIFYSFAGAWANNNDTMWVFTTNTYAVWGGYAGLDGKWNDMAIGFYRSTNLVAIILCFIGLVAWGVRLFVRQTKVIPYSLELVWLIYGVFFCFFIAHSCFWAIGLFNSLGLVRVFDAIIPEFAIMVTVGFNVATEHWYSNKVTLFLKTLLLLALLHIPFSRHETSVWRNRVDTLLPSYAQEWATKTAEYVNENYPNRFYYYCNPQLAVVLKEKEYIVTKWKIFEDLRNKQAQPRKDAIVIWDSQFTPIDNSVTQEAMDTDPRFEFVKEFPEKGRYIWFRIYKVK